MDPRCGAFSIRTFEPADFDQVCNLYADGMNYYCQTNGYEGLRGVVNEPPRSLLPATLLPAAHLPAPAGCAALLPRPCKTEPSPTQPFSCLPRPVHAVLALASGLHQERH
jgi:hypothetical protein